MKGIEKERGAYRHTRAVLGKWEGEGGREGDS